MKNLVGRFLRAILPETELGDRIYSTIQHLQYHKQFPRIKNPRTFNEHMFRLKVGGEMSDPLRQLVSDKYAVKKYVSEKIGPGQTIETLDLLESDSDVDNFEWKQPCVLKPTHASGIVMMARSQDEEIDKARLKSWLNFNYYNAHRERNYRTLTKRVIVEEFFSNDGNTAPDEYKVLCFRGDPKIIQVDRNRFKAHTRSHYLTDWSPLPFSFNHPALDLVNQPAFLGDILETSCRIAQPFSFIRVDFMVAEGQVKIGELTNCHASGFGRFYPEEFDQRLALLFDQLDFDPHLLLSD